MMLSSYGLLGGMYSKDEISIPYGKRHRHAAALPNSCSMNIDIVSGLKLMRSFAGRTLTDPSAA